MKKNFYTYKESAITYIFCFVFLVVASLLLSLIVSTTAKIQGVEFDEVKKYESINYISFFLSSVLFLVLFIFVNLFTKSDFKVASRLKTKFNVGIFFSVLFFSIFILLTFLNITGLFNYLVSSFAKASSDLNIFANNFWYFLLQVLLLALFPAVFEELIFRGVIYNGLRQKFSCGISILLSAVMFMLIHMSIFKCFYQLILGLILGLLVYLTGTIFYGMVFHFINNFTILLINYLFPNGFFLEFKSWGTSNVIITILLFLVGIIGSILFFYFLKKYTFKHKNYLNLESTSMPLNLNEINEQNKKVVKPTKNYDNVFLITGIVLFSLIFISNSFIM